MVQRISNEELSKVKGGFDPWVALGIAAAIVFISGIIEGITNPERCNS